MIQVPVHIAVQVRIFSPNMFSSWASIPVYRLGFSPLGENRCETGLLLTYLSGDNVLRVWSVPIHYDWICWSIYESCGPQPGNEIWDIGLCSQSAFHDIGSPLRLPRNWVYVQHHICIQYIPSNMHKVLFGIMLQCLCYQLLTHCGLETPLQRHRCGSPLVQVMACCLTSPSHYLNQCLYIITEVLW